MNQKIIVVYNPESGRGSNKKFVKNVTKFLEERNFEVEFIATKKKGDAIEIVKNIDKEGVNLVLISGGDGTLNEAITGNIMRKERLELAYLPFGTTNDVGHMYGLTKNYMKDLKILVDGIVKNIDVCYINKKPFVYVCCLGNLVNVSYETPRRLKKKYGKFAYIIYGLKQIKKSLKSYELTYKVNGETHKGKYSYIFITNSSRIAGVNGIYNDVKLDDKMFEVVFCNIEKKQDVVKVLYEITTKDIESTKKIEYYKTDNVEIIFDEEIEVSWCIDGEEYKEKSKVFKFTLDNDTKMLVPRKNIKKLFKNKKGL